MIHIFEDTELMPGTVFLPPATEEYVGGVVWAVSDSGLRVEAVAPQEFDHIDSLPAGCATQVERSDSPARFHCIAEHRWIELCY
jgi:hypothetical protein